VSARQELGRLESSGLIQIAALQPELEYLFRHALVQEAAYASLLKQDRRSLHRAAAEAILTLHPEREREFAGVLAMHFEAAGDNGRAASYFVMAGDHALERFANRESIASYVRALALADDSVPDVRLRAAIGAAKGSWSFATTGHEVEDLEAAVAAAGPDTDKRLLGDAYFWIAYMREQRGEVPETSPALKDAMAKSLEIGSSLNDPRATALPRAMLGAGAAFTGHLRRGAEEMRAALADMDEHAEPTSTAMISDFLAMSLARLGDFDGAQAVLDKGKALADHADDISRVDIDIGQAVIDLERGNFDKAAKQALECSIRADGLGAYACVVAANVMYGAATLGKDDAAAAKPPLERGDELAAVTNMAPFRTLTKGFLASSVAQLGDISLGIAGWNEALANARGMHDRYGEARVLWARGHSQLLQTPPDCEAALADFEASAKLFEEMEARPTLARVLIDQAKALSNLGRAAEAAQVESRALALGRELGLKDRAFT
jgi:tetratricopeptide (TPR) repeat protein